jgi:cation:H+ antiporter
MTQVLVLLGSFALLLAGALFFTNAVEWAGRRLRLGTAAVGSILAAVATALPESVIPMIAVLTGEESGQVAIGAIIGAPLLLATLAMLLIALSARGFRSRREQGDSLSIHRATTIRDLVTFVLFLGLALGVGLVPGKPLRIAAAVVFVVAYGLYAWWTVRRGGSSGKGDLKPLHLDPSKHDPPANWQIIVQLVLSLAAIISGAQLFVWVVEHLAAQLSISALVLALVLAPLATELPEKANSFLWIRKGADALAVGNITGAMVFQSMVPVAFGMAFTPWQLDGYAAAAVGCALLGGLLALAEVLRGDKFSLVSMATWAVTYGGFVVVATATI